MPFVHEFNQVPEDQLRPEQRGIKGFKLELCSNDPTLARATLRSRYPEQGECFATEDMTITVLRGTVKLATASGVELIREAEVLCIPACTNYHWDVECPASSFMYGPRPRPFVLLLFATSPTTEFVYVPPQKSETPAETVPVSLEGEVWLADSM